MKHIYSNSWLFSEIEILNFSRNHSNFDDLGPWSTADGRFNESSQKLRFWIFHEITRISMIRAMIDFRWLNSRFSSEIEILNFPWNHRNFDDLAPWSTSDDRIHNSPQKLRFSISMKSQNFCRHLVTKGRGWWEVKSENPYKKNKFRNSNSCWGFITKIHLDVLAANISMDSTFSWLPLPELGFEFEKEMEKQVARWKRYQPRFNGIIKALHIQYCNISRPATQFMHFKKQYCICNAFIMH